MVVFFIYCRSYNMDLSQFQSQTVLDTDTKSFFSKVFLRMGAALAISWSLAWYVFQTPSVADVILNNELYLYWLVAIELWLVRYLSANIKQLSPLIAQLMFILYSAINGVFLSVIFFAFELNSIVSIFWATTAIFIIMWWYWYTTNKDLTKLWSLAFTWLIWIIIWWLINFRFKNSVLDMIVTSIGIIIFVVLIAYDIQKLKNINTKWDEWTDNEQKEAILWALELYLDFINLFLKLLRLFWKRK